MNDFWEMVIPAAVVSTIFLIVFGFLAFNRYLRYKETVALAERGLLRPERERKYGLGTGSRRLFNIGIVLFCVGVGFFCTLIPVAFMVDSGEPAFVGIILGVLPASVGLALMLIDRLQNRDRSAWSETQSAAHEGEEFADDDPIPPHKGG